MSEADAKVWFYGDGALGQPPVAYADNGGGNPTISRTMLSECRELLISAGVLEPTDASRDVASYCVDGLTRVVD